MAPTGAKYKDEFNVSAMWSPTSVIFEIYIYFTVYAIFSKLYVMTKASPALTQMPPSTLAALAQLGADLAVARLRRKESLKTWAKRLGVSVPTLLRLEAGEPSVSLGVLATALWLIGRDAALGALGHAQGRPRRTGARRAPSGNIGQGTRACNGASEVEKSEPSGRIRNRTSPFEPMQGS